MELQIRNNTIVSHGKFTGQPRWAPYFWAQVEDGLADAQQRGWYIIDLTKKDRDKFPELCHYDIVRLKEEKGFVSAEPDYD